MSVLHLALVAAAVVAGLSLAAWQTRLDAGAERQPEIRQRFDEAARLLQAGHYAPAAKALTRVLVLAPQMPEAHANLGFALLGLREARAARLSFEAAIALRPQFANAYYGLALAHEALGERPEAIGAMRTYVHLAPPQAPHVRKARAALWEWQAER
jgi:tetratricopeptide (TPR) repeat protein